MDLKQYLVELKGIEDFILADDGLQELVGKIAITVLISEIDERVVETGLDFEGVPFSKYSQKKIHAQNFIDDELNKGIIGKLEKLKDQGIELSYEDLRDLHGYRIDIKNFTFTGQMWRFFGLKKIVKIPGGLRFILGGLTDDAQDKIDNNSEYENVSIIAHSIEEGLRFVDNANDILAQKLKVLQG